jgi:UDP-glucose 4-epimerase
MYKIKNKNILITGGTGQIGSFLSESLVDNGANVTVLGRKISNLKEIKSLVESKKIKFVEYDLINEKNLELVRTKLENIDYLLHFSSEMAELFSSLLKNAMHSVNLNLKGIIQLLKFLPHLDGILYASSIGVYGIPKYLPIDEECPTNPVTFYGCGKLGAEKYLKLFSNTHSVPLTMMRYSSVYGPRNRTKRALPTFINLALEDKPIILHGNGDTFNDFIYISDVIDATKSGILRNQSEIYNIGSGIKCTVLQLAQKIIELTNSKSQIKYSNKSSNHDNVFDISKAKNNLGFFPKVSIEEGLMKEIAWHKKF